MQSEGIYDIPGDVKAGLSAEPSAADHNSVPPADNPSLVSEPNEILASNGHFEELALQGILANRRPRKLHGHIDLASSTEIVGWVWDPKLPKHRVRLELISGTNTIATTVADVQRPGLEKAGIGDGRHAFRFALRESLVGESELQLHIRCADTLSPVPGSPVKINVALQPAPPNDLSGRSVIRHGRFFGQVSCKRGLLEGWIAQKGSDSPVEIAIIVDGTQEWRGLARRRVQIESNGEPQTGCFGFRCQLSKPSTPIHERVVELQDTSGNSLLGGPFSFPHGDQYIGFLEAIEYAPGRLRVGGWCLDTINPSEHVKLTVECNGSIVARGETHLHRDVSPLGFDAPYAAFLLEADVPEQLIDPATVHVRPDTSLMPLERLETLAVSQIIEPGASHLGDSEKALQGSKPDDVIEGTIDQVTSNFIRGWARNKTNPEAVVLLDCYIDGILFSTVPAQKFRADLKKHFGDHGCYEFYFELPPTAVFFKPGIILIKPSCGVNQIKQKVTCLNNEVRTKLPATYPKEANFLRRYRVGKKIYGNGLPHISLIVINKNGSELLNCFFSSFDEINTYENYEIVVLDHQSIDDSMDVVHRWASQLSVRWQPRDSNYSFSNSNNVGASLAKGDIVLFVNNDVRFTQDVLAGVATSLADPRVGCVGIKLFDDSQFPRADLQFPIQHLGIHFGPSSRGASMEAFESRYAPMWHKSINDSIQVPAVTGAFMACRRDEFLALGGFDERYFYGFEDVDLCLKYLRSGATVVAANDLAAAHLRGYSRTRMEKRPTGG